MEALPILPVKASHQAATPQGTPQGPRSLGDVFQALLQEATIRLDARPADLAAFETRRESGEPGRRLTAAATISSVDIEDRRDDSGFRTRTSRESTTEISERSEPVARDDAPAYRADDTEAAALLDDDTPAPESEPEAAARPDDAPENVDNDTPMTADEPNEALAPVASGEDDDPVAIAATIGLPLQAQQVAATAALGRAQAFGAGQAALDAAAAQAQLPANAAQQAQTASNIIPAAVTIFAANGGASRVQVTPAAVVAQPNAALGGGAAAAALAAEAAQNGVQNAQATQPGVIAASQAMATTSAATQQPRPGARAGDNDAPATGPTRNGGSQAGFQSAAITQNPAIAPAPSSGAQDTVAQGSSSPAAGEPGSPNPRNAHTPFADSHNAQAANSGAPSGLTPDSQAAEKAAQNGLAQNARSETARSLNAPAPVGDGATTGEQSGQGTTARTPSEPAQSARPAHVDGARNPAAPANHADTTSQPGAVAQTNAQNTQPGSTTAMDRAATSASFQRIEGAGQSGTSPASPGTFGLNQAATRTPQTLPAQARPAAAASLPANQVAVHIQRAVGAGQDRIRITLHPAELGQIDVKLKIGNDGAVRAIVSIERPETFELLQRDARGLEKALQDAGLKTDSGSLSFNLKGESEQDAAARREGAETGSQEAGTETPAEPELEPEIIAAVNSPGLGRALDLHV